MCRIHSRSSVSSPRSSDVIRRLLHTFTSSRLRAKHIVWARLCFGGGGGGKVVAGPPARLPSASPSGESLGLQEVVLGCGGGKGLWEMCFSHPPLPLLIMPPLPLHSLPSPSVLSFYHFLIFSSNTLPSTISSSFLMVSPLFAPFCSFLFIPHLSTHFPLVLFHSHSFSSLFFFLFLPTVPCYYILPCVYFF